MGPNLVFFLQNTQNQTNKTNISDQCQQKCQHKNVYFTLQLINNKTLSYQDWFSTQVKGVGMLTNVMIRYIMLPSMYKEASEAWDMLTSVLWFFFNYDLLNTYKFYLRRTEQSFKHGFEHLWHLTSSSSPMSVMPHM